jgi:iron(III) transport system permease protein
VDFISWLPFTVPGIVLSLGLLAMFLLPQFRPFYGSLAALVLALIISGTPLGVQIMKGNLVQLGKELEEASWMSGGSRLSTYWRVVLPLISPTLVVVALMAFISATRNISQVVLLSNSANRPLSVMQLDYLADGRYGVATVIAAVLLLMSVALALLARYFGYRGAVTTR